MKTIQTFLKNIFMLLVLISIESYASTFEGVYISNSGVQLNIFKIGDNTYSISSNHSNHKTEKGHDWKGTGVLDKGNYIGVFKYLDSDTKYRGLSGSHIAESINGSCFLLRGTISGGRDFGPFKYCKQQ